MKRKLILLTLLLMLTTACSIQYNLEVSENNDFEENFTIVVYANEERTMDDLYYEYLEEYPIFESQEFMYYDPYSKNEDYSYYEKKYEKLNNGYLFNYDANYTLNNFEDARSINTLFNNISIGYLAEKEYYYISLNSPTKVLLDNEIEKLTINVTFDKMKVISSNATNVNRDTYTWTLSDPQNFSINIKYQKEEDVLNNNSCNLTCSANEELINPNSKDCYCKEKDSSQQQETKKNNTFSYIILGAVLILFFTAIFGLIKCKSIQQSKD